MILFLKLRKQKRIPSLGFTIIELLVAVSIILILTAIVVGRQVNFNSVALLESQAYELAFDIRRAQVQATAVRGEGAISEDFRYMYGIRIVPERQSGVITGRNHQIVRYEIEGILIDGGGNQSLNISLIQNFGLPTVFDSRFRVEDSIIISESGVQGAPSDQEFFIFFRRPEFDAHFYSSSGAALNASAYLIRVRPVNDDTLGRQVRVTRTGQITVEQLP